MMATDVENSNYRKDVSAGLENYHPLRIQRYAEVNVLLLSWKDGGIDRQGELDDLTLMFRDMFRYRVWPYKIPSGKSQSSLNLHVAQFLNRFGEQDKLIIVYYGGHGGPTESGTSPFVWAAENSGGPTLDWSMIQPSFLNAGCDVVILLDCCYAGQAARSRSTQHMELLELLAATDKDQWTPIGKNKWPSFTKVMMAEMKAMLKEYGVLTIAALQKRMVQADAGLFRQPFYVVLSGAHSAASIKLARLEDTSSRIIASDPAASLYLKISLFDHLSLSNAASLMRWLTKDSPGSIQNIQMVQEVLEEAQEANQIGLQFTSPEFRPEGKLLSYLSNQGRNEGLALFNNLKTALSSPISVQLTHSETMKMVDDVKERSRELVTFVEDSIAHLDGISLRNLQVGDGPETQDLRNRIAMRLTLIADDPPEGITRVAFDHEQPARAEQRFRTGVKNGVPVVVEYFYPSTIDESLRRRVQATSALHAEPKNRVFRSLQGLGHVQESLHGPRFGFVYQVPEERVGHRYATLCELINQVKTLPLEVRIRTASALCDALLHLHSIGWYHKDIKSENILIFAKSLDGLDEKRGSVSVWDFENPFLVGFNCSRPSEADTRGTIDFTTKDNIFRHPERWGRPVRFERHHDLYALGILLLEVGCWRRLPNMDSKQKGFEYVKDPETLRSILLDLIMPKLAHAAGTKLADAVRFCLESRNWAEYEDWQTQKIVRKMVLTPLCTYSA